MSKTITSNPTTNIFELLQVDSDLPEKRGTKGQAGGKKLVDSSPAFETPAEKGQRRKAQQAQAAAIAAAEKQQKEAEALLPSEGFQVQKGSQTKKPAEKKQTLKREDFETTKPVTDKTQKPFSGPKKTDKSGKPFDQREGQTKPYHGERRQNANPARPPKHEGFDKHSGAKTSNKPGVKRQGGGQGNWGNDATQAQQWEAEVVTTPTDATPGWGDEGEKKPEKVVSDDKAAAGDKPADAKEEKDRKPAWDEEEGHGKMLLEQFQKEEAAKREAALAALGVGVKSTGRTVEPAADSKFKLIYRDTTDEKEKILTEERKKQIAEEKKKRQQERAGEKRVDVAAYTNFGVRGVGGGRGRGGRDRPPRTEGEQGSASPDQVRAPRGGRGGQRGPGNNKVPTNKNAFPELGTAPVKAAPVAAPKSTK